VPAERAQSHYFSVRPETQSGRRTVTLRLRDMQTELVTDRGVFSFGRIDPGTAFLLDRAPPPPSEGDVLDLGCGYGAIAVALAHRAPRTRVWAVDVNERARELARLNTSSLGNVSVSAPDEVPGDVRFTAIYSNPPIRVGKDELHTLLLGWLGRLAPQGKAYLVVQRNLGADSLQVWLRSCGWRCERLGSRRGYRLLEVRRAS
jgi:16S rRNA (guanine1207-N2)-methyltransferase